jgi:hypothetical protein
METWAYDDLPVDPREDVITNYLDDTTDDFNLAKNAGRMWGLYLYLTSRPFQSPADVQSSVFMDSQRTNPMFTESQATSVFELLNTQKGGAINASGEQVEILDNMIIQWINRVREWTPAFITDTTDTFAPYVFILKGLEENEEYGVLLGVALDATEAGLKSTAAVIQNMAPVIIGLLPLPEAGPIGAVIGWMVASVFIFLLLAIHVSRRQFGQAFIVSFGLIPIVGESLYNAAMSGEKFAQKTFEKRGRLVENVRKMLGDEIADTLDAIIPNPLAPAVADDQGQQTDNDRPHLNQYLSNIGNTFNNLTSSIGQQQQTLTDRLKIGNTVNNLQSTLGEQPDFKQYISQIGNTINKLGSYVNENSKIKSEGGGKGFSRKQAKTSKWRTQRRKFVK